jgi:large subunit ribosomal protein L17
MRHRNAGIKLGRTSSHREAMFRNMVTSLLKHDRIRTTDVKAKELRRWADKIVTLAKQGDLHSRRQALAIVREKDVVHKLFAEAADRFGSISGGYTRIVKAGNRPGDAAPISIVELVAPEKSKKKEDKKKKPKISAKKKTAASKKAKGVKKEKTAPAPAESPPAPVEGKA